MADPATPRPTQGNRRLPTFDAANRAYVKNQFPEAFKQQVGGHVDDTRSGTQWLTDTCTLRLSRAFNYSGVLIPENTAGLRTVHGADKLNYAYSVQEFKRWVLHRFGKPDIEASGPPVDRHLFAGHHGLIIFDIHFGNNPGQTWGAQGHADLWDGATFYDELWGISTPQRDFFAIAHHVSLWLMIGQGKVGQ